MVEYLADYEEFDQEELVLVEPSSEIPAISFGKNDGEKEGEHTDVNEENKVVPKSNTYGKGAFIINENRPVNVNRAILKGYRM